MRSNDFQDLPPTWQGKIKKLRFDCARYRVALREAEQRIAELEAAPK